jgi:hypothetical protein
MLDGLYELLHQITIFREITKCSLLQRNIQMVKQELINLNDTRTQGEVWTHDTHQAVHDYSSGLGLGKLLPLTYPARAGGYKNQSRA